jgi:hypothetical protein
VKAGNTTPWHDEIRRVPADGAGPVAAAEHQHLCYEHGADPATVARDAPTPELAGRVHDTAHLYAGAPWGEVVVRAWAESWWQARQWQCQELPEVAAQVQSRAGDARQRAITRDMTRTGEQEPQVMEDPAEWRAFFREVLGRDMPRNAEHEATLHQLGAAGLLTPSMWANGPDGTSYLHGFDIGDLAAERGGLSFPQLHELRYLQLSAGRTEPGARAQANGPAQLAAASFPSPAPLSAPCQDGHDVARQVTPPCPHTAKGRRR